MPISALAMVGSPLCQLPFVTRPLSIVYELPPTPSSRIKEPTHQGQRTKDKRQQTTGNGQRTALPSRTAIHGYSRDLALGLRESRTRHIGVVRKNHERALLQQLRQQALLVGERFHGVKVETHDPWVGEMKTHRDEVGDETGLLASRFDPDALHVSVVTGHHLNTNAGNDFALAVQKLGLRLGGPKEVRDVARAIPLRRTERMVPLPALHEVAGARKRRDNPRPVAPSAPAAVV